MLKKTCGWLGPQIGYLLYTLVLLLMLLWLLFPKEACHRLLARYLNNAFPQLSWRVQSMTLEISEGITLRGIEGYEARDTQKPLVCVDTLVLEPDIAGMVQTKHLQATYRVALAQGVVTGVVQMDGWKKGMRVNGSVHGVQLAACRFISRYFERDVQGAFSATFNGRVQPTSGAVSEMEAKLDVDQGSLGLKRPILNHTVLPFSHAEVILRSQGGTVQLEQGMVDSELFSGHFSGEIKTFLYPAASQFEIRGTMQPLPGFFKGVDNASLLKVIRAQLKERSVPFRVSGELHNPGIHFEEFSLLFQSLKKELQ